MKHFILTVLPEGQRFTTPGVVQQKYNLKRLEIKALRFRSTILPHCVLPKAKRTPPSSTDAKAGCEEGRSGDCPFIPSRVTPLVDDYWA